MNQKACLIELRDVNYKRFLDIPELCIQEGSKTAIMGTSGSGKSTLLRLMNKMISPVRGKLLFKGQAYENLDSVLLRRRVMLMNQSPMILPGPIKDQLAIGFFWQERPAPDEGQMRRILDEVGLEKRLEDQCQYLSGGEKQRLALARILLLDPEVYLLDEPTAALDQATQKKLVGVIANRVATFGKTLVMVTHDETVAFSSADRILRMEKGCFLKEEVL